LDRHSNSPANGFHPFISWRSHWLSERFLLVVALFLFAVAVAPASVLNDSAAVGGSLSDEIFRDPVHVICFDLTEELSSATIVDALAKPPDPVVGSKETLGLAILSALASLPGDRGVWLLAVSPWIWSVIAWHSRPRWRRRIRRNRYLD
jgi:hypothetical protein